MRAVRYHEHGGPEVLGVEEVPRPEPAADQVLVEVRAASVNPVDTKVRAGVQDKEPPGLPSIPGTDVAGVVAAVGEEVERFAVGDRAFGDYLNRWTEYQGSFAEYVAVPIDRIVKLPDGVDFDAAAAAAHAGTTAWSAIVDYGELRLADTCLVHGGAGGVGHIAVQLAREGGAEVIATAAPEYHDRLRGLGADHVLDYDRDDLGEAIAGAGAPDVILDHMIGEYFDLDVEVAAPEAVVVSIEAGGEVVTFSNAPLARQKDLALYQIAPGRRTSWLEALGKLGDLLARGDLDVVISGRYGLEDAAQAHRDVIEESFLGKLVVRP